MATMEKKRINIPNDLLLRWFLRMCEGNRIDFLFQRSTFAANLAESSYFHLVFGSCPMIPVPFLLLDDRQHLIIPGFAGDGSMVFPYLPLTDQVLTLLPNYVLKGTFSQAMLAIGHALWQNGSKIRVLLNAFVEAKGQRPVLLLRRIEHFSVVVTEDDGRKNEVFPFELLDHLITTSNNAFWAQTGRFGWI
jgi:hypothetical protein